MKGIQKLFLSLACLVALVAAIPGAALAGSGTLFVKSAVENPDGTVTLPLFRGLSHGQTIYYVIIDTSDGNLSQLLGVNTAPKLANFGRPSAVQKVTITNGVIDFPVTVDFSPEHVVSAPGPFPPAIFHEGATGEPGYTPLALLPDGIVVNAPHVARDQNGDGRIDLFSEAADKVVSIDTVNMKVVYRETEGVQGGKSVRYASFDSSNQLAAALEDVTYAPALDDAATLDDDSTASSRASLAAFVNGQTGRDNPQRQGLNSAVLGGGDPINVLRWNPSQGRYSPLWDVHLAAWTDQAVAAGTNTRQNDYGTIQGLVDHGFITAPGGSRFAASGFIVNCPIISSE